MQNSYGTFGIEINDDESECNNNSMEGELTYSIESIQLPFKSVSIMGIIYLILLVMILFCDAINLFIYFEGIIPIYKKGNYDIMVYIVVPFGCYLLSLIGVYIINKQKEMLSNHGYLQFPYRLGIVNQFSLSFLSIWFPLIWVVFLILFQITLHTFLNEYKYFNYIMIIIITCTLIFGNFVSLISTLYCVIILIQHNINQIKPEKYSNQMNNNNNNNNNSNNNCDKNIINKNIIIKTQGNKIRILNKSLSLISKELLKQKTINNSQICLKCQEYKRQKFSDITKYKSLLNEQKQSHNMTLNKFKTDYERILKQKNLLKSEYELTKIELNSKSDELKHAKSMQNIYQQKSKILSQKLFDSQNQIQKLKMCLKAHSDMDINHNIYNSF